MVQQQDWTNFSLQRPNYFPGQYLLDEDFELSHKYLSDRQRYLNSKLHLAGIVEGLEVEAIAGEAAVTIKSGTAIDGEGNLIILPEEKTNIKINSECWVCLRYFQEPKVLQQPEIPDSFTRWAESPLLTLEAIETKESKTVILAKLTLDNGQITVDNSIRQYSGARLPSGQGEEINLRSDGKSLAIKGNLSISGTLQLGGAEITGVSETIATDRDRTNVVPSEKAVKQHIEEKIKERLATLGAPTEEKPTISLSNKPDGLYGWSTEDGGAEDSSSLINLISYRAGVKNTRLTIQRDTGNVGIGTTTPERKLDVNGVIRASHIESTNPMRHRMYPNDAIVYQDIFDARDAKVIAVHGVLKKAPADRETRHTSNNLWNDRRVICYGGEEEDDAGALVTVPEGYDTLWIRLLGDTWKVVKAQFLDGFKEDLGRWAGGRRYGNCYCPDGSLTDSYSDKHQWLPIPVGRSGKVTLISKQGPEFWLSGLAFSKNPWSHATQSALGYHWKVNGGDATTWEKESDSWNGDAYTVIPGKTNLELLVPAVWSGRDKLLYLIEHNSNWNGCMHTGITVNGNPIERFLATYDNPFARHWNSKSYNRYIAAYIPADLIPKPRPDVIPYLKVKIDMSKQNSGINLREIGTHDVETPYIF
ncbi:hypothetical protein H6G54_26870 [Anabaena cylindrica FACHB-243]|uniref:Uncharacterized protein n=1 Tax=Anabaena cylindrica (strain ATCC 27899 / PCC 7122) TaxID=272123 RepID=K9Z9H3_ANACC|nr:MULTISPECIES: hypothetical protein [Anabaena]AFZ55816.1 hypothetical protein Anacy_0209 [Anabaena cylindrica PCC 7122]MBD2421239.1 hypothetical protein [Anabaena cylindrica FACHB-243]MBY5284146.1 hypothetical protein [Anabaena sp. CCAP 1446/1C]MBY5308070.1 hypothetical protein [Anabaena sp. CCAP 1446/1C]MCM2406570.1 hypothetical protein [Anabaena sp. CCAP 1446/1C]